MQRHGSSSEEQAEIDLTPMLDVVFIMLIFFIVTASFVKETGIDIKRPDSTNEQQQQKEDNPNIVVQVSSDDQIWIDGRRVDIESVRAVIERMHAEKPKGAVIISANNNATAKIYTAVADAARSAKVYNVNLVTTQ